MASLSPLHVSYSAKHGDGGIAFAVADLLAAQQDALASSKSEMAERVATNKEIAQLQVGDDGTDRRVSG